MNKIECVVEYVSFKVVLVGLHSKNFSTLCLDDVLSVESSKIVEECKDEGQESYILNFAPDKQHKNTPHFKADWITMHYPLLDSIIFIPPSYE